MLGGKPCAFPALQETLTDPDLGKFGFAKAPATSQYFVAMRLQGPVGPDLAGMHFSQRDHRIRVVVPRQLVTHDDIGALFSLGGREVRLQAELHLVARLIRLWEVSAWRKPSQEDQSSQTQVPKS